MFSAAALAVMGHVSTDATMFAPLCCYRADFGVLVIGSVGPRTAAGSPTTCVTGAGISSRYRWRCRGLEELRHPREQRRQRRRGLGRSLDHQTAPGRALNAQAGDEAPDVRGRRRRLGARRTCARPITRLVGRRYHLIDLALGGIVLGNADISVACWCRRDRDDALDSGEEA